MEPEQGETERRPKRVRKRRQAPSELGGAAEAMRAGWQRAARLPLVKVSGGRPEASWGAPAAGR